MDKYTSTSRPNYYDILHVQQSAPRAIIKNAYRAMMMNMKLHPDLGGDTDQAALINEAYEVLSDVSKRAEYDKVLSQRQTTHVPPKQQTQEASKQAYTDNSQKQKPGFDTSRAHPGVTCGFCGTNHAAIPGTILDCGGCGSPMDLPPNDLNTQDSARRIERITKDTDIEVRIAMDTPVLLGRLRDLSPQGLGFVLYSDTDLAQNSAVKISCDLFEGTAVIAHRRDLISNVAIFGAKFSTLRFHSQSGNFVSTKL